MATDFQSHYKPTLGFLCPLYAELKAVRAIFDEEIGIDEVEEIEYIYGKIGPHTVVAVQFLYGEVGPTPATEYAARLLQLHPCLAQAGSYCFLVGTAGGIWREKSDLRLGDVVIATRIHEWRSGQLTQDGFVSTRYPVLASDDLRRKLGPFLYTRERLGSMITTLISRMREEQGDLDWHDPGEGEDHLFLPESRHRGSRNCHFCDFSQLQARYPRLDTDPWVHDGLLASGPVVLKDDIIRRELQDAGVLAVDMEACGVPKNFVVVKGISNYADSHKNDTWQPYAAATAAACARLMIDQFTSTPALPTKRAKLLIESGSSRQGLLREDVSHFEMTVRGETGSDDSPAPISSGNAGFDEQ